MPLKIAARVTDLIAAFIPGASPPEVRTPIHLMFEAIMDDFVVEEDNLFPNTFYELQRYDFFILFKKSCLKSSFFYRRRRDFRMY